MIIVWGTVEAQADHWDEAMRLSLEHVERSRAEPGCLSHAVHIDTENPNRLVFFEEWESMVALQHHFQVPASIEFVEQMNKLAAAPAVIKVYEAVPAT